MTPNPHTQLVRPAGAGHETLYVLLFCAVIAALAGSVVFWHRESTEVASLPSHQLDARRDLSAAEQGIYADLRVALDEIRLQEQEQAGLPEVDALAQEGFAPFARDASAVTRGGHRWQLLGQRAYLGLSTQAATAGSFLLRVNDTDQQPDIWLNRADRITAPVDLSDTALVDAGWRQVITRFDAGVTRQHQH